MAAPRLMVGALTLATLAAALVGCSGDPDADDPSPTPSPSASRSDPASGPLEVTVFGAPAELRAYEQVVTAYEAENPEVQVTVRSVRDAESVVAPLLPEEGSTASPDAAPGPDVFLASSDHLAELVAAGRLLPVDTLLEEQGLQFGDDYQRAALTAFSANDRLQCMPAEMSPLVLYYNKDLVEEVATEEPLELPTEEDAGWSWESFVDAAAAVADSDGTGPVKGAWFPADIETLTAFVRSAGGDVVDAAVEPTSLNLTSDEALTALGNLTSFALDDALYPTAAELESQPALERFTAGRLGFVVGTRADLPQLRAAQGFQFDVLPLPSMGSFRSVAMMDGWCVNADSDQVAAATDFVAFAVGEDGFQVAAESGALVPTNLEVIHDEAFTQPAQQPANAHVWATSVRRSEPLPYSPAWGEVAATVEAALQRLFTTPGLDLEATLEPQMEQLNEQSEQLFAPPEEAADTEESTDQQERGDGQPSPGETATP